MLFDRSGRSRPLVSDIDADLSDNTAAHLIADIEALRALRGIERWTVLGLSWGTTLALAYAQTYPDRVDALVLAFVTTTSHREVQWITETSGAYFRSSGSDSSMPYPSTFGVSGRSKPMPGCLPTPIRLLVISLPENGVRGRRPMSP
jgi:proline iminopeptidase